MVRDLRVCAVLLPGKDFHFHFHQAKINFPFHVCRTWVNMGQQMNCLQGRDTCFQIWKVISISKEGVFLIGHNCWSLLDPAIHLGLLGLNHCSALMLREVVKKDQNTIKNAKHAEFAENAKYTNMQNIQNMQNIKMCKMCKICKICKMCKLYKMCKIYGVCKVCKIFRICTIYRILNICRICKTGQYSQHLGS